MKLNWDTNYLIPKFLKNFINVNYYKTNFLKEFTIVSMLRNYTSNVNSKKVNSLIFNKNLIIKPINTKNLTVNFTKTIEQDNFTGKFKVYKIVIHINNSFNPTNISLFDKESKIHFYQIEGDKTLHINIGLLTFFNILISENLKLPKRKSKSDGDYYMPNSNLSLVIGNLIKTQTVTLYSKNLNKELIWSSEYCLFDNIENPLYFTYDSEEDIYWRYDLKDIPLFIHNLWWDVILILLKIYDIKLWKSLNKYENTSNNFRLKTIILQLLGGFSKLNMFEKLDKFTSNHYVINKNNLDNLHLFEAELIKINETQDEKKLNHSLDKFLLSVGEQFNLTENIFTELKNLIFEGYQEIFEDPFDKISFLGNKLKQKIEVTKSDEVKLKASNITFTSNYQFNVILIYILSLEMIIKITSNLWEKNKKDFLQNILFTAIKIYIDAISFYKNSYLSFNLDNINLEVPSDWIDSLNNNLSLMKNNNKDTFSFNLLISGIKINYNSVLLNGKNKDNYSNLNYSVNNINNRKFSTLISRSNTLVRKFSTNREINKEISANKVNYNKSMFSVLNKIKELTKVKNYNPEIVQLSIENIWTDIIKEKYQLNTYKAIQDLQPHIYKVFILNDFAILKRVFPSLYLFTDDIRIFLITYNVITTYFRRLSRTAICRFVADQVLFFIFKTYFLPLIIDEFNGKKKSK